MLFQSLSVWFRLVISMAWCSAPNYFNSKEKFPNKSFFYFPSDPETSRKWVEACRRPDFLEKSVDYLHWNCRLCSDHFSDNCFTIGNRKRLLSGSCPTFNNSETAVGKKRKLSLEDWQYASSKIQFKLSIKNSMKNTLAQNILNNDDSTSIKNDSEPINNPNVQSIERFTFHNDVISSTSSPTDDSLISESIVQSDNITLSEIDARSQSMLTGNNLTVMPKTRKIRNLRVTVSKLRSKMKSLKNNNPIRTNALLSELCNLLPVHLYKFVRTQLQASSVKKKGRRWSYEFKSWALNIYLQSPSAYNICRKLLCLPSKATLQRSIQGLSLQTGFCEALLSCMEKVVEKLPDNNRKCIVLWDEMAIKTQLQYNVKDDLVEGFEDFGCLGRTRKIADHALVFMARGLHRKWKQPVGYFFTNSGMNSLNLRKLLESLITKLHNIGLTVVAVVCDQSIHNQNLYKNLGICEDKPYFELDNQKIYAFHDPPHLLKCLRNNLQKYTVRFGNNCSAKWEYVKQLYEFDIEQKYRCCSKLTKKHIYVKGFDKMNVRLAAQIFSHSVASGIWYLCALNYIPSVAAFTADFISTIDSLFDSLNGKKIRHKTKPLLSSASLTSTHITFWDEKLKWIKTWKFQKHDGTYITPPCKKGWLLTVSAALNLVKDHCQSGSNFIIMGRLNQDSLENMFSIIRGKGGHRCNPNISQFCSVARATMVQSLFKASSMANCKDDLDETLLKSSPSQKITEAIRGNTVINPKEEDNILPNISDFNIPSNIDNAAMYVAGYIAHKVSNSLSCELCISNLKGSEHYDERKVFLMFKQFENCKSGLTHPSEILYNAICNFGNIFRDLFNKNLLNNQIMYNIKKALYNAEDKSSWPEHMNCKLLEKIIHCYTKIMLFHTIKLINNSTDNGSDKSKQYKSLLHL